jgi:acyl-CoA thioester hydrolase
MSEGRPKPSLFKREGGLRSRPGEGAGQTTDQAKSALSPSSELASRGHLLPPGEKEYPHLAGALRGGTHVLPVRVYYEDTDFSGVVYHASYLRFLERGRTDYLRLAGVDQSTLHAGGDGLIFAVRRMTVDYLKPARMDDVLTVETRTAEVRGASLLIAQRVLRDAETIVTADVRVAAVAGGRPVRIPDALRAILGQDADAAS